MKTLILYIFTIKFSYFDMANLAILQYCFIVKKYLLGIILCIIGSITSALVQHLLNLG